jgi:hypothetical protein
VDSPLKSLRYPDNGQIRRQKNFFEGTGSLDVKKNLFEQEEKKNLHSQA